MKTNKRSNLRKALGLLAVIIFGLSPALRADVLLLQSGALVTGKVLQHDGNGVLMQTESGTYRYPQAWIKDVKPEAATAPHVSNNGQTIPDWAQIVTLLADSGFAPEIKQVPASVIGYGNFKNVPYLSFRCAFGGYEINIYGDLNEPAAIQIGAMNALKESAAAKSNCVNFVCSVLASADARKMVRALKWDQKDMETKDGLMFETLLPGEMGSYGGWWLSVYNQNALASAQASDAELLALAQPRIPAQPMAGAMQPAPATNSNMAAAAAAPQPVTTTTTTTYDTDGYYGWTAEELAAARPVAAATTMAAYPTGTGAYKPADTAGMVYPRTYTRTEGTYRSYRR
jgi:hypothetical protein